MPSAVTSLPPRAAAVRAASAALLAAVLSLGVFWAAQEARAAMPDEGKARPGFDKCRTCHFEIKRLLKKSNGHAPFRTGRCAACHNPHAAPHKGLVKRDVGELCRGCHAGADKAPGHVHTPYGEGKCLSCHNPHASDNAKLMVAKGSDLCFSCHGREGGFDARHGHTPARRGQCLTCHAPHGSDQPALVRREPAKLCAGCHPVAAGIPGHRGRDVSGSDCMSCHNPHGSERGALVRGTLHEPYGKKQCAVCHGPGKNGAGVCLGCHKDVADGFAAPVSHVGRGEYCLSCHSPHASDNEHMLRAGQRRVCLGCHEDTARRLDDGRSKQRHPLVDEGKCTSCHRPHGSDSRFMLAGDGVTACTGCHDRHATFTHPVGKGVLDPRSKGDISCITCHGLMGSDHEYALRFDRRKTLCIQCHKGY